MAEVRRNEDDRRYEVLVDREVVGFTDFRPRGDDVVVLPHTVVDEAHRGQGLSEVLIGGALDDLRARSLKVIARCPAVAHFIDEHDDADLLADP